MNIEATVYASKFSGIIIDEVGSIINLLLNEWIFVTYLSNEKPTC